jgi:hypothetical protein
MQGEYVGVSGRGYLKHNIFLLKVDSNDLNPVQIDIENGDLDSNVKKFLFKYCTVRSGCPVTLFGVVVGKGVLAEEIDWRSVNQKQFNSFVDNGYK